jgi:hypothetical protein
MKKKNTQAEVRRRDVEIDAEQKEIQDLKDTPPGMLDDLEKLKLMKATGKPVKEKSFDEKFKEATPVQRRFMMAKGGSVSASKRADGCAVKGKTKGKMV